MTYAPPANPAAAPYDEIVRITYLSTAGQAYQASGVMVSPDVVLTAAHVVDDSQLASITVTPDQSGDSAPYGSTGAAAIAWLPDAPEDGQLTQQQSQDDLGVIALATPLGEQTGWMALDPGYAGGTVETAGYPALYNGLLEAAQLGTAASPGAATLTYPSGTVQPGSSGSPLWTELDGAPALVGVVSTLDWAAQLTASDAAFVEAFEAQHPAPGSAAVTAATEALSLDGDAAASVLTDDAAPILSGTGPAGATLAVSVDGTGIGTVAADAATGAWSLDLPTLAAGAHQVTTTQLGAAGTSARLALYETGTPVAGTSSADVGSLALSTLLGGDASPDFLSGTAAVQLLDGRLELGSGSDAAYLTRLYAGLLGRAPDEAGLSSLDAAMNAGASRADVAAMFLGSAEYQASHAGLSDSAYVGSLYAGLLGRAADPAALAGWTAALGAGSSRATVAADIAASPEAQAHSAAVTAAVWVPDADAAAVGNLYQFALDRAPSAADLQFWTGALRNGLSLPQLATDLTGSAEFAALHGAQGATAFVTSLYADGLGRAPDAAGLQYWSGALQAGTVGRADLVLALAQSSEATAGPLRTA